MTRWLMARMVRRPMPDGPCLALWVPVTCRSLAVNPAARIRSPIHHVCLLPRAQPHVCFCFRCGNRSAR